MPRKFSEHSDVNVPKFVDFSVWQDTSWHNDITASVEQKISEEYSIKVWVYDSNAWKESEPLLNLFHVCVIHNLEGWTTEGYILNTEEEVLAKVQEIKADVDLFILKMGWC